ncbi:MAG: YacL family protein [Photobacterium frigidiphilum]|uniref:YacL family protein n=1 Tax=Photobacterium frigidiphilum TaxID=264736 RepID=UPI003003483A
MDYEFKKNTLDGSYHATFSMGHETIGRWLIEEVGKDFDKMDAILSQISALKNSTKEWRLLGDDLSLILQDHEVIIQANYLFSEEEEDFDEDMHFYDDESVSCCGFEDFELVLQAWRAFVIRF